MVGATLMSGTTDCKKRRRRAKKPSAPWMSQETKDTLKGYACTAGEYTWKVGVPLATVVACVWKFDNEGYEAVKGFLDNNKKTIFWTIGSAAGGTAAAVGLPKLGKVIKDKLTSSDDEYDDDEEEAPRPKRKKRKKKKVVPPVEEEEVEEEEKEEEENADDEE